MKKKSDYIPLGIVSDKGTTGIFTKTNTVFRPKFFIVWSKDNLHFRVTAQEVIIYISNGRRENPHFCSNFKFTETTSGWIVTYIRTSERLKKKHLVIAIGKNLYELVVQSSISVEEDGATLATDPASRGRYFLYLDELFMRLARSKNLHDWHKEPVLLLTSRPGNYDSGKLTTMGHIYTEKGILVFYDTSHNVGVNKMLQVGAVLFAHDAPWKVIWRSQVPLWSGLVHEEDSHKLYPLGVIAKDTHATFYWGSLEGALVSATVTTPFSIPLIIPKDRVVLKRAVHNPVLEPEHKHEWESEAVFNPAAVYDNGKVHLFYRAIGKHGISVLGYATSKDGFNFSHRLAYPVYEPKDEHIEQTKKHHHGPYTYDHLLYGSGGGWNGYEDPRAVKIGKQIYVTYLAFGGWDSMRMALTSINEKDLEEERWRWKKPKFISPPGQINKNWVLFPEKIHGKFAILHSITPHVLIQYIDSFEKFDGTYFIKSHPPHGGRPEYWDSKVRGVGPPPLKTELGWLIFYHANDNYEPYKYKLGAMILDKDDPKKILYRTSHPILCPDMRYENDGKPGIVYASGAIIKSGNLFVYYGGGDKVVCVATAPLKAFLESIKKDKAIRLEAVKPTIKMVA